MRRRPYFTSWHWATNSFSYFQSGPQDKLVWEFFRFREVLHPKFCHFVLVKVVHSVFKLQLSGCHLFFGETRFGCFGIGIRGPFLLFVATVCSTPLPFPHYLPNLKHDESISTQFSLKTAHFGWIHFKNCVSFRNSEGQKPCFKSEKRMAKSIQGRFLCCLCSAKIAHQICPFLHGGILAWICGTELFRQLVLVLNQRRSCGCLLECWRRGAHGRRSTWCHSSRHPAPILIPTDLLLRVVSAVSNSTPDFAANKSSKVGQRFKMNSPCRQFLEIGSCPLLFESRGRRYSGLHSYC